MNEHCEGSEANPTTASSDGVGEQTGGPDTVSRSQARRLSHLMKHARGSQQDPTHPPATDWPVWPFVPDPGQALASGLLGRDDDGRFVVSSARRSHHSSSVTAQEQPVDLTAPHEVLASSVLNEYPGPNLEFLAQLENQRGFKRVRTTVLLVAASCFASLSNALHNLSLRLQDKAEQRI